jgi:hypothetical protein
MMQANQMRNLALRELKRKGGQARSERKADAARANGCKGGRPRKIENPTKPNRNPTETHNENETKPNETILNENETRSDAPPPPFSNSNPAPTVDDLFSDSPSPAAIDAIIKRVADAMGDNRPSVHKWRKFIEERGARAFCDIAHAFCDDIRNGKQVDNMGAYFNALLDSH